MPNRLAEELSPYLLHHRNNPVDWHPWGPEALDLARREDRPILLSIGYAACHWCHVMERESFEDSETAAYMNAHFVPVKVDREERPDLDALYMVAVQSMTGHGGWPLTVFLDPDGVPFHGGTYYPPEPRHGMPSFLQVMEAVVRAWEEKREEIGQQSEQVRTRLGAVSLVGAPEGLPDDRQLDDRADRMIELLDPDFGGFGGAPKFPSASSLDYLLGRGRAPAALLTLDRMAAGGLWDQLGGGFARYSVDREWIVPHFEKMLYDNALLARTYLHAWQETGAERFRRIAIEALDWALDEMTGPGGGFFASLDADSEGEEGLFYTWTEAETAAAVGDLAARASQLFGITEEGNFEGRNVLFIPGGVPPDSFTGDDARIRKEMLDSRQARVRPATDDKVISSWNSLMVSALADAGAVLGIERFLDAARATAEFIWSEMRDGQGTPLRIWRDGRARIPGFLEDHAFLLEALLDLYEATFETVWFDRARAIAELMIDGFADPEREGFFSTSGSHEDLIARRKEVGDHPIPAGSSSAALGLLRLAALTGNATYEEAAEGVVRLLWPATAKRPDAFGHLLKAAEFSLGGLSELAIIVPEGTDPSSAGSEMVARVRSRYRPALVVAAGEQGSTTPPLLGGRDAIEGRATAWLCRNFSCEAPTTDPAELGRRLDQRSTEPG